MPRQTDLKKIAYDRCVIMEPELMDVDEPGEWAVYSLFTKPNWRLEEDVAESQDHGNEPGDRHLNPRLAANTDSSLVVQESDFGPAGMKQLEPGRVFKERKDRFANQRHCVFEAEAHYHVPFEQRGRPTTDAESRRGVVGSAIRVLR